MKITLQYSQRLYYKEDIELTDKQWNEFLETAREWYKEDFINEYDSFEEFLDEPEIRSELFYSLGVSASCREEFVIDGDGIEDEHFIFDGEEYCEDEDE